MKRLYLSLLLVGVLLFLGGLALASDISTALFRATITITNNSTATANESIVFSANSTAMIDMDYMNDTANNTALLSGAGADIPYMPGYNGTPWVFWLPSIGEDMSTNDILYIGGSDNLGGEIRYFPGTGGMETIDSDSLELGDNWTIEQTGWFDVTQVGDNLTYKKDAIRTYIGASGNISSLVWAAPSPNSANGTGWDNHANAYDENTGTYAVTNPLIAPTSWSSWITLTRPVVATNQGRYFTSEHGDITLIDFDYLYSDTWNDVYQGAFNGNVWETRTMGSTENVTWARVRFYNNSGANSREVRLYEFDFSDESVFGVSATGISGGERIISTSSNTTHLILMVDDSTENTTAFESNVTNNSENWTCLQSGVMPYMEHHQITIDGVLQQHIEWQYSDNFTDLSGNGHHATPTFRTTSSNSNVIANLTNFQPVSTATAPAYTITDAPFFNTGNITASGNFTSGNVSTGGPPGSSVIEEVSTAGGTPNIWLWGILAIFGIAMGGLFLSYMERKFGGGGGTLIIRIAFAVIVFGLLITFGKFDWWMLMFYLPIVLAIAMASRHIEWGSNVSQHGLIGFLAMSWIGLTIINRIMEGQFITANERVWTNYFAFTQEFKVFDIFSMPVLNFSFFTHGIPSLIKWDYSFFGGNAQLFQYLLYSITAVVSFIICALLIGLLFNAFRAR